MCTGTSVHIGNEENMIIAYAALQAGFADANPFINAHSATLRACSRPQHFPESAVAVAQRLGPAGNLIDAHLQLLADFPVRLAPREPFDDLPPFHYRSEFAGRQDILEKDERFRAFFKASKQIAEFMEMARIRSFHKCTVATVHTALAKVKPFLRFTLPS
jgi:hypothetical protein